MKNKEFVNEYIIKHITIYFMTGDVIHYIYRKEDGVLDINYFETKSLFKLLEEDVLSIHTEKYCDNIIEVIITSLNNKKPVIIFYDPYYNPKRIDVYQKKHLRHPILINRYDNKTNSLYVIEHTDWETLSYRQMTIPFVCIEESYNQMKWLEGNIGGFLIFLFLKLLETFHIQQVLLVLKHSGINIENVRKVIFSF